MSGGCAWPRAEGMLTMSDKAGSSDDNTTPVASVLLPHPCFCPPLPLVPRNHCLYCLACHISAFNSSISVLNPPSSSTRHCYLQPSIATISHRLYSQASKPSANLGDVAPSRAINAILAFPSAMTTIAAASVTPYADATAF
ncbi:hypothetical protein GW17_00007818 [Ensete ventricosum]|nr:hypothetical protein GW17_00007818 [Ensete ventricosum]